MLADHSHFESVIERLQQQAAAQAKHESYKNYSAAAMGEEEVWNTATHNINVCGSSSFSSLYEMMLQKMEIYVSLMSVTGHPPRIAQL